MPRTLLAAAALTVGLSFSAMAEDSYDAGTVLATVNGSDITLGHVVALLDRLPQQYKDLPDDRLYTGILEQLVDQTIFAQSLSASPETDSYRMRLTVENERVALLANRVITDLSVADVSDADLQAAYDAKHADFEGEPQFNASHILVATEEEALALIETLNGGADFAELAKEKSTGPSGPNGGELGWFGLGQMVPPFEAAVTGMDVGAISAPVQTQFGFHVVKLNDNRISEAPTLDDERAELTQAINEERMEAALQAIRDKAVVTRSEVTIPPSAIREIELLAD